jgi:hypothetical protein
MARRARPVLLGGYRVYPWAVVLADVVRLLGGR